MLFAVDLRRKPFGTFIMGKHFNSTKIETPFCNDVTWKAPLCKKKNEKIILNYAL
jgi:hypothetical protein